MFLIHVNSIETLNTIFIYIIIYIISIFNIFCLLFLTATQTIKSIIDLISYNHNNIFIFSYSISFLSMGGIPPLSGFFTKLLFFNILITTNFYIYIIIYILFLFLVLYFYLRNLKYTLSINLGINNYIWNVNKSLYLINCIIVANVLLLFGFILLNDLLLIFYFI